jgi:hypothetical protein
MDMVLGAEWLMQLGTYATNLQEQFMEFKWHGKNYKLYGSRSQNLPLKELTNLTLPMNKSPKYSQTNPNQDESPQGKMNSSGIALRTKHSLKGKAMLHT